MHARLRANPELSARVRSEGENGFAFQRRIRKGLHLPGVEAKQPFIGGSEPDPMHRIPAHRGHAVQPAQITRRAVGAPRLKPADPGAGANPHRTVVASHKGADAHLGIHPGISVHQAELSAVENAERAVLNPKPKTTILRGGQTGNNPGTILRLVWKAEGFKVDSIESNQPLLGAQPEKAILGLRDGADGIDRQSGLPSPGAAVVLIDAP